MKFCESVVIVKNVLNNGYLAILESKFGNALIKLVDRYTVDLESSMILTLRDKPNEWHLRHPVDQVEVQILIYGCLEDAQSIGDLLSSKDIYLQHPTAIKGDVPYENPHHLKRPNSDSDLPPEALSTTPAKESRLRDGQVELILQSAEGPQVFTEVKVSPVIRTQLKK